MRTQVDMVLYDDFNRPIKSLHCDVPFRAEALEIVQAIQSEIWDHCQQLEDHCSVTKQEKA